jgi:hypothetical protein
VATYERRNERDASTHSARAATSSGDISPESMRQSQDPPPEQHIANRKTQQDPERNLLTPAGTTPEQLSHWSPERIPSPTLVAVQTMAQPRAAESGRPSASAIQGRNEDRVAVCVIMYPRMRHPHCCRY